MANRIKEIRKSKGISQEELSKRSGVSRVMISMLETDQERTTTTTTLLKLARALGVTADEIFLRQPFNRLNEQMQRVRR